MTVSDETDDSPGSLRAVLRPFPGQTPAQHVLVGAAGLAIWSVAFLAILAFLGGESVATADSAAAVEARRLAGVLAGVACGAYLGFAFALEQGGPVTNLLFAPLSAAVGATGAPIEAVYGTTPDGVFAATGSGVVASLGGGVGTAVVLAAATVVTVAVVGVHLAFLAGPAHRRLVEAWFAELPVVHLGPRPLADWRRADGSGDGVEGAEGIEEAVGTPEGAPVEEAAPVEGTQGIEEESRDDGAELTGETGR